MGYDLTSLHDRDLPISDEGLWEEFRQGNRGAYQKLYSKYLSALYNYDHKIIPDKAVVTD